MDNNFTHDNDDPVPATTEPDAVVGGAEAVTRKAIADWLRGYLAQITGMQAHEIDVDAPFERFGLDSYQGVVMAYELGDWLGCDLDMSEAFEYPTVGSLAAYLAADARFQVVVSRKRV